VTSGGCEVISPTHRMHHKSSCKVRRNFQQDSCNGVCSFYSEITISLIPDDRNKSLFILLHMFVGYSNALSVARLNRMIDER
jgi:hypothetical protein